MVLTVRADFYNPLVRNPSLSALLPQTAGQYPADGAERSPRGDRDAGRRSRLAFAPAQLVDQILNDVGTQEGRLPLLQFALKETWERRDGNKLTAEAYTAVGGVTGAIEKTAEAAYERLTPAQKDAARRLFFASLRLAKGRKIHAPGAPSPTTRSNSTSSNSFPIRRSVFS